MLKTLFTALKNTWTLLFAETPKPETTYERIVRKNEEYRRLYQG